MCIKIIDKQYVQWYTSFRYKTLCHLKQKHSAPNELNEEVLLRGEKPSTHPIVFEDVKESIIKKQH